MGNEFDEERKSAQTVNSINRPPQSTIAQPGRIMKTPSSRGVAAMNAASPFRSGMMTGRSLNSAKRTAQDMSDHLRQKTPGTIRVTNVYPQPQPTVANLAQTRSLFGRGRGALNNVRQERLGNAYQRPPENNTFQNFGNRQEEPNRFYRTM